MFQLTLQQGSGVGTMLWVTLLAVILTGVFYYRAFGTLRHWQWQTLLVLRILAILIVVLLLFRPVLSYHKDVKRRKSVVFALDVSSSMGITDDATGRTRFEHARSRLEEWWGKLGEDFRLHLLTFSDSARVLEDIDQLATVAADGRATSLSRALASGATVSRGTERAAREEIEAIVLISDGIHNSARDPEMDARKLGVMVHTVGVGAGLRNNISYRDIQLASLNCPDSLLLNNRARVTASVEAIGLAGRVVRVILEEDDEPLEEVELTLDGQEGTQEVEFEFRPTRKGRHVYRVRIPPLEEEKIDENNHRSAIAMVVEPGIRVLYIEGTLRQEYGAISQRFLSKDPDLEFCSLVQTRPNVFLKRTNIEGLQLDAIPSEQETIDSFDVFIFGDLDASYIKPTQQELIVRRVRDGGGLIMLGGYHALGPGGYGGTPLGDILPLKVGPRDIGQVTDVFLPKLTPDGTHSPIFANIAGFFPTQAGPAEIDGLPMLAGCTRVAGASPGATVLATCPVEFSGDDEMPMMAVQPVGDGRAAVFCGDTTRAWQQGPRAMDRESPFLQFWGQMVRYMAGRSTEMEPGAGIEGGTDRGHYDPEEEVKLTAVVRNAQGEGTDTATVLARVEGPEDVAAEVELAPVSGSPGNYSGTYLPQMPGEYEVVLETRIDGMTLSTERAMFAVGRPNMEFDRLDLDEEMLARIASASGGTYAHITTADHTIDSLDRKLRERRDYLQQSLAPPLPLWGLFVLLLTAEWILRRRFQLR